MSLIFSTYVRWRSDEGVLTFRSVLFPSVGRGGARRMDQLLVLSARLSLFPRPVIRSLPLCPQFALFETVGRNDPQPRLFSPGLDSRRSESDSIVCVGRRCHVRFQLQSGRQHPRESSDHRNEPLGRFSFRLGGSRFHRLGHLLGHDAPCHSLPAHLLHSAGVDHFQQFNSDESLAMDDQVRSRSMDACPSPNFDCSLKTIGGGRNANDVGGTNSGILFDRPRTCV